MDQYMLILEKIRRIVRSINLESKRIQKAHGISIPQLLCLNFLNHQTDFKASHKEIKNFLQLNASTLTGIVNRLEKKGYVARLPKKDDKRVEYIIITGRGSELLENIPEPLHEKLSERLQKLSSRELQQLIHSFDMIINLLDLENVNASAILTAEPEL